MRNLKLFFKVHIIGGVLTTSLAANFGANPWTIGLGFASSATIIGLLEWYTGAFK